VYIALKRLEKKGLVLSTLADPTSERGGRAKRYYRIQPEALRRLRESRDALLSMWEGLEAES
jgi:DNA-binding PadR family transcriptional regulator